MARKRKMQAATATTVRVRVPDADPDRRWRRMEAATHIRGVTTFREPMEDKPRDMSLRDDPLGRMRYRGEDGRRIGDAQYRAGRQLQAEHEAAGIGHVRSSGDIREHVDGGQISVSGPTQRQMQAAKRVAVHKYIVEANHGVRGWEIVHAVCIDKQTLKQCALRFYGQATRPNEIYVGRLLREGLSTLATSMGFG